MKINGEHVVEDVGFFEAGGFADKALLCGALFAGIGGLLRQHGLHEGRVVEGGEVDGEDEIGAFDEGGVAEGLCGGAGEREEGEEKEEAEADGDHGRVLGVKI